jgi:sRNA-binding carbon storage regulator CsrA
MLVLSRKANESVVFDVQTEDGRTVSFSVSVWTKGSVIRMGIDAGNQVRVRRGELDPQPREAA